MKIPDLLALLYDENGVNTIGNGIGHDAIAILDENTTNPVVLNDYYESDIDSYQSGEIRYPFTELEDGLHTLSVKVWDVFNNSSEALYGICRIKFSILEHRKSNELSKSHG